MILLNLILVSWEPINMFVWPVKFKLTLNLPLVLAHAWHGGLSVVFGIHSDVFASFILYLYGLAYLSKLMKKKEKKGRKKKKKKEMDSQPCNCDNKHLSVMPWLCGVSQ